MPLMSIASGRGHIKIYIIIQLVLTNDRESWKVTIQQQIPYFCNVPVNFENLLRIGITFIPYSYYNEVQRISNLC